MGFVHLHNHTQFSVLNGMPSPNDLVKAAEENGMPAVAITDTCNLFCAVQFYKAAKGTSVKPIFGSEIWLWPEGLDTLPHRKEDGGWHLAFLIENTEGYSNLSKLITEAIYDGMHYRPRIDYNQLEKYSKGLIALTSGLNGPFGHALSTQNPFETAKEHIERLGNIFGPDHLFLEMQDFAVAKQPQLNDLVRQISAEMDLKTIISNDVRYIKPQEAVSLDVLNCIAFGDALNSPERNRLCTDQQYFKSEEEMVELFPNDLDALQRTVEIADRCYYKFNFDTYHFPATTPPDADQTKEDGTVAKMNEKAYWANTERNWEYFYRAFPPPKSFGLPDPSTGIIPPKPEKVGNMSSYFEWYCEEGLIIRLGSDDKVQFADYWERLDFEMDIIESMGFPAYMLIVAEFINWSKDNDIPVGPGRGSAAGSLVAWAMGITDIDPLKYQLLFERFLNPERISMPDIDVDFCQDRRDQAIDHVRDKYGAPLVSQIITYGKLAARAAIKDIARALGVEFRQSNDIAGLVPEKPGTQLKEALAIQDVQDQIAIDQLANRIFKLAVNVEGKTRQTGIHAAGVVIADKPLVEYAPLYRDGPEGGPVVQYDMKSSESIGLIKFDFLGLKTLDQIRDCNKLIKRNTGVVIDMATLPTHREDPAFQLLKDGDSVGVFQLESQGMQGLLKRMKPDTLEDVIASIALFRPGPLSSGMDKTFVACKNGEQEISYAHPKLEKVLSNTYGSIVYQEQVMQIAQELANYSLGEADLLRRAMGKKDVAEMERQKSIFVERSVKDGVEEDVASHIFDLMAYFAGYGFNKSHSAAYGWISYQTAWLKAHYRSEYMASLMSSESGNSDKVLGFIRDCLHPLKRENFIPVLNPDLNKSFVDFDVAKGKKDIRYGLIAIKGVGRNAIEHIIEVRDKPKDGSTIGFTSFMDFLERIDYRMVNKKVLENLIRCGALDWTGQKRKSLLDALPSAIGIAQNTQAEKLRGQMSLFGDMFEAPPYEVPDTGEWPILEKMKHEKDALGFYLTDHPMSAYADITKNYCNLSTIPEQSDEEIAFTGMIKSYFIRESKNGGYYGNLDLEDKNGMLNVTIPEDKLDAFAPISKPGTPLLLKAKKRYGSNYLSILEFFSLIDIQENQTKGIRLHCNAKMITPMFSKQIQEICEKYPGKCPIEFSIQYTKNAEVANIVMSTNIRMTPTEELIAELIQLFGNATNVELLNSLQISRK